MPKVALHKTWTTLTHDTFDKKQVLGAFENYQHMFENDRQKAFIVEVTYPTWAWRTLWKGARGHSAVRIIKKITDVVPSTSSRRVAAGITQFRRRRHVSAGLIPKDDATLR